VVVRMLLLKASLARLILSREVSSAGCSLCDALMIICVEVENHGNSSGLG